MPLDEIKPLEEAKPGSMTIVEERTAEYRMDDGDADRFSHYVPKDKIVESAVTGKPVRALCGKKWIPSRDPERFPVCPDCRQIYDALKKRDEGK